MKRRALLPTLLSLLFSLLSLSGQSQDKKEAEKLFADIAGTWRIQTIYDGKRDVTKKDSLSVQWMEFKEEGRYRSEAGKHVLDSGSYRVNESSHSVYLQSDVDKSNPAEWNVEFKDNTMVLSGKGPDHAKRFKYVYVKTKTKETENRPIKPQQ